MSDAAVATATAADTSAASTAASTQAATTTTDTAGKGGYLGADTKTQSSAQSGTPAYLFRENFAKDGNFVEGWSETFAKDYPRLAAKGATAKSEAAFLKMMDDTIGFASGKRVTRPDAAANEQAVSDYRSLVGAPHDPAEYAFKPSKIPQGMEWDDNTTTTVNSLLHKHHAPKELAAELAEFYTGEIEKQAAKGKDVWESRINDLGAQTEALFRKEWGEDHDARHASLNDFIKARKLDTSDPIIRAAINHPAIAPLIDEARRASREAPIPGVDKEVFTGSASPRQLAQELMKSPAYRTDPAVQKRVADLYAQDAQREKRKAK